MAPYSCKRRLPPGSGDSAAQRLLCDDLQCGPTKPRPNDHSCPVFDFPVANPVQHPYTLDVRRMLPAAPVCVAVRLTTAVQEVASQGNEENSQGLIQKQQILRFATNFGPHGPDGCHSSADVRQPNRKRSDGPQADRTRRDRIFRLPFCHAASSGRDHTYNRAQGRASARHTPQTIRLAQHHQKDAGFPAASCRRASARSSIWLTRECWWMPSTRKKHGLSLPPVTGLRSSTSSRPSASNCGEISTSPR